MTVFLAETTSSQKGSIPNNAAFQRRARSDIVDFKIHPPVFSQPKGRRGRRHTRCAIEDQKSVQLRQAQQLSHRRRCIHDSERPVDRLELLVELYERANARGTHELYVRQIEPDLMDAFAQHLREFFGQMIGPISVDTAFNDQDQCVAGVFSCDFHFIG